jgi:hypothetical protein
MSDELRALFNHVKRAARRAFLKDDEFEAMLFIEFDQVNDPSDPMRLQMPLQRAEETPRKMFELRAAIHAHGRPLRIGMFSLIRVALEGRDDYWDQLVILVEQRDGRALAGFYFITPDDPATLGEWHRMQFAMEKPGPSKWSNLFVPPVELALPRERMLQ